MKIFEAEKRGLVSRHASMDAKMIYTGQTGWLQGNRYGFINGKSTPQSLGTYRSAAQKQFNIPVILPLEETMDDLVPVLKQFIKDHDILPDICSRKSACPGPCISDPHPIPSFSNTQ